MSEQDERKSRLLEELSRMGSAGRAEAEDGRRFPRMFQPVREHLRALEPEVVLVLGPRGAGKSELFEAAFKHGLLPHIERLELGLRLSPASALELVRVYPRETEFTAKAELRKFVEARPNEADDAMRDLWFAYVARAALPDSDLATALRAAPAADAEAVLSSYRERSTEVLVAMDALDRALAERKRTMVVAFDELDGLVAYGGISVVRGLVSLWAEQARRWQSVRAKIFLRSDLYARLGPAGGADLARLAANRVELTWSERALHAMLLKRLLNADETLREYCERQVAFVEDEVFGRLPSRPDRDAPALLERIIGTYMGDGPKKGRSVPWLLDHVRDGRKVAIPRPLVILIEQAARFQAQSGGGPRWPRLLEPKSLRWALDKVSEAHVKDCEDEWPWLRGLRSRIGGQQVPWKRQEIEALLRRRWDELAWDPSDPAVPAPAENPRLLVEYLLELGVFRARADGRVDTTDLFLAGLQLKRKGGVGRS